MSYEAWGDYDDGGADDHLLDAGWWDADRVAAVVERIKALEFAPEPGNRLHAQLVLLKVEAEIIPSDDPHARWAEALLSAQGPTTSAAQHGDG